MADWARSVFVTLKRKREITEDGFNFIRKRFKLEMMIYIIQLK